MTRSRAAAAPDRRHRTESVAEPAARPAAFEWTPAGWACGGVPLAELAARYGTPLYCYGLERLLGNYAAVARAFPPPAVVCYSVKANPNLALLSELAWAGAGFDVVSGGELQRVLRVAGTAERTVFAGVGKTPQELREAVKAGLLMLNVESPGELAQVLELARSRPDGPPVAVALRVNPDVDARTHRHVTTGMRENKFGMDRSALPAAFEALRRSEGARLAGLHAHIGSQVESSRPYAEAVERLLELVREAREAGLSPEWVNAGGGFAVPYDGRQVPSLEDYAAAILPPLEAEGLKAVLEVGRAIAADAGALVTRVLYDKEHSGRRVLITDAGMNDLLRPALYGAWHRIWPAHQPAIDPGPLAACDVAGPICESSDYFAAERELPPVSAGDLLVVFDAGAYGMSMASQYNSHPRAAEVLVSEGTPRLVRRRETFEDLVRAEDEARGS